MNAFDRIKISQMMQVSSSSLLGAYSPLIVPSGSGYSNAKVSIGDLGAYITGSISPQVYSTNLVVSLLGGKTFGRYSNGQTIPSIGKTAAEVIQLAINEPIDPTATLTSPTTVQFNQTVVSSSLNFSYVINNPGASIYSTSLQWRRNNSGSWTVLTSNTSSTSYTHSLTDTNFNSQPFNYRYLVLDSIGSNATASLDLTPTYVAPSISLSVVGTSITSPESNTKRERGNVSSSISGTVTRNNQYVSLASCSVQYRIDNGVWIDVPGLSNFAISGSNATIPTTLHTPNPTASTIDYRAQVIDTYQTTTSSTTTVSFLYMIYYGPSAIGPASSADVKALGNRIFTDDINPYNLLTGTTYEIFTSAMPSSLTLSEVIDLDAFSVDITSAYILSTFNVGGVPYNVYTLTNAIPYTISHRHKTTRI